MLQRFQFSVNAMNVIDVWVLIALLIGMPIIGVIIGVVLITFYPGLRTFVADILRLIGFISQAIRRKSIENEIEGSINSYVRNFNAELQNPLLFECTIKWVKPDDQTSYVTEEGKAIVKVSFSENHHRSFYNAVHSLVSTGLLYRTKPFIKDSLARAIDFFITRAVLIRRRKHVLPIFNDEFAKLDTESKDKYYTIQEIDSKGLFKRILLQEYYLYGEVLGESSTPHNSHIDEADNFLEWLYEIAVREKGQQTNLSYNGNYIKVGIILVADEDTFNTWGLAPYIKRAQIYASNDYNSLYLLARGRKRGSIVRNISNELEAHGNFERLTQRPEFYLPIRTESHDEEDTLITCIALRPNLSNIVQSAWEKLETLKDEVFEVTIELIHEDFLTVNVYGLKTDIFTSHLSSLELPKIHKYFRSGERLKVRIINFDQNKNIIELSNIDTETDPRYWIEKHSYLLETTVDATVTGYNQVEGYELGIFIEIGKSQVKGYIPRSKATYSRYIDLSQKYRVSDKISIFVLSFDIEHGSYLCQLNNLTDPWEKENLYIVGSLATIIIREITERYITCELEEGIEGRVYLQEISPESIEENAKLIKQFQVGSTLTARVIYVDLNKRVYRLSFRQVRLTPKAEYFQDNQNKRINVEIIKIHTHGAEVQIVDTKFRAFLHISEIIWSYCDNIDKHLSIGQTIQVCMIAYDFKREEIFVSIKQLTKNSFEELILKYNEGDEVKGILLNTIDDRIFVHILVNNTDRAIGYVHKSEISNLFYVSPSNINKIFNLGDTYTFAIKKIQKRNRIVELSRNIVFKEQHKSLQLGVEYEGKILRRINRNPVFYSSHFEAIVIDTNEINESTTQTKAIIARLGETNKDVEVELSNMS